MKILNKVFYRTSATLVLAITMASSFSHIKASASEPKVVIQSNSDDLNKTPNINKTPKLMLAVVQSVPTTEVEASPMTKTVTEPVTEAVTEPVTEAVTEPVTEAVTEPVAKPVAEPVAKPVAKPVAEPVAKPVAKPVAEPVTEPVTEEAYEEEFIEEVYEEEFTEVVYEEEFTGITGQPNVDNDQVKIQLASAAPAPTPAPKNVEKKKVVVDQVNITSKESNIQNTSNVLASVEAVEVVATATPAVVETKKQVVASNEKVKSTPTIVTSNAVFLNEGMTSLPQTGESTNQLKLAGLMLLGALGALMALVLFQRREKTEKFN